MRSFTTEPTTPKGVTIPTMTANILWADDEIDLLRPHVLFLQGKGYTVDTVNNGLDAVDMMQKKEYDIVFLDENMPGLSGLETLDRIKLIQPRVPIVMITKSEEEQHHGRGHRRQDQRLPDQAREPEPDPAFPEEEPGGPPLGEREDHQRATNSNSANWACVWATNIPPTSGRSSTPNWCAGNWN
jgi:CheY-like chemotaxis protein